MDPSQSLLLIVFVVFLFRAILVLLAVKPKINIIMSALITCGPLILLALFVIIVYKMIDKWVVQRIKLLFNQLKEIPQKILDEVEKFFKDSMTKAKDGITQKLNPLNQQIMEDVFNCENKCAKHPVNEDRSRCVLRCRMENRSKLMHEGKSLSSSQKVSP